jgi:hypothetical protein
VFLIIRLLEDVSKNITASSYHIQPRQISPVFYIFQLKEWTCSITRLVIEQVLQNAPHFAVF